MISHTPTITRNARTALIVTAVAALVWIFAESESLTTRTFRPDVIVEAEPNSLLVVRVSDPAWRERPDVVIEGSTSSVAGVESLFGKPIRLHPGIEGMPSEPGEHTVDLKAVLREWTELASKGVTIVRTDPASVRVHVEQLVERDLPVEADLGGAEVDAPTEVVPNRVRVRLTASEAAALSPSAVARARLTPETLRKLLAGRPEVVNNVAIELPEPLTSGAARAEPAAVSVQLTLRNRTAYFTIPSVPVYVSIAAVESGQWDVIIPPEDRFITDVQVSGPGVEVDRVRRGEVRVTAQVVLTYEDLERGITAKEVTFGDLPTGLSFRADLTKVRVVIQRRVPSSP